MQHSQLIGIMWMLFHCLLVSSMAAIIRGMSDTISVFQMVFFYNAVAFIALLPWAFYKNIRQFAHTTKLKLHVFRGVLGYISLTLYFYAFTVIPLTDARAIALTNPLCSSLMAIWWLKERIGVHRITSLVGGFIGALIILNPLHASFSYVSFLVIIAVIMWGIIDMIIKNLSKTEGTAQQLFYITGIMTICSIPGAILTWETPDSIAVWLILIIIGIIFLINTMAVFLAFKHADVTTVMPFDFSGMVFTTIIAWFFFNEMIALHTAIGSLIVMLSSIYLIHREHRQLKIKATS